MPTDVPLLNDYKKSFVRRRLLQTFLAGLRVTGCPWYSVVAQLIVFLLPGLLAIPFICLSLELDTNEWQIYLVLLYGGAIFILAVFLQSIAVCLRKRAALNAVLHIHHQIDHNSGTNEGNPPRASRRRQLQFLLDEDDTYSEGCCSAATWSFILPAKRHNINIVAHSVVAAIVASSSLAFLLPENVQRPFRQSDIGAIWTLIGFGWFSVLQSLHAVILGSTPETATFRALDTLEIGVMSRPFHVFLIVTCPFVVDKLRTVLEDDIESHMHSYSIHQGCYIGLTLLPVIWFLGLLPPLEPLTFWALEQTQIFLFGGSASASPIRSVLYFVLSVISFLIIIILSKDISSTLIWSAAIGYLLSLDLYSLAEGLFCSIRVRLRPPRVEHSANHTGSTTATTKNERDQQDLSFGSKGSRLSTLNIVNLSKRFAILKEILMHTLFFTLNILVVALIPTSESKTDLQTEFDSNGNTSNTTSEPLARPQSSTNNVLGWVTIVFYIAFKVSNELQKVYLLYGIIRSPLYSDMRASDLTLMIWYHLRALFFNFVVCLYLVYYFKSLIREDGVLLSDILPADRLGWLEVMAIARTMRWIWQNTESALIEFCLFHLMVSYAEPLFVHRYSGNLVAYFFEGLTRPIQLILISFFRDRAKQVIEKIYFVTALSISALEERASRRPYAGCLFQMNIIFSPIILAIIIISSIFSTPILTIFTLPIFLLAYPRPSRFWPGSTAQAAPCQDTVYYDQMIPPLISSIHQAIRAGKLGIQQPGNFLLARHEDRLAYIQIMEKGNGYTIYSAKGLELQETSCHSLEATRLDDIFQDAFERCTNINHFAFHSVTPLASVSVRSYSASKSALTGIIESPDTLKLIAKTFTQTLIWYTILRLKQKSETSIFEASESPQQSTEQYVFTESPSDNKNTSVTEDSLPDDAHELYVAHLGAEIVPDVPAISTFDVGELSSWHTSTETSPEQERIGQTNTWALHTGNRSATYRRPSKDSLPSILNSISLDSDNENEGENIEMPSLRRKGLLPPIKQSPPDHNIHLPGRVVERTPQFTRRKSGVPKEAYNHPEEDQVVIESQYEIKSSLGKKLSPLKSWILFASQFNFVFDNLDKCFPVDWIKFCIKSILSKNNFNSKHPVSASDLNDLLNDDGFLNCVKLIVFSSLSIVYDHGGFSLPEEVAVSRGPWLVAAIFRDAIPWTLQTDWLISEAPELYYTVILPAFRCAVKLGIDQIILGPHVTFTELEENVRDVNSNWHLGMEEDQAWQDAVLNQVPNLFTMASVDPTGRGGGRHLYRSHILTLRDCQVNIGRINAEVVKGLWASLSLELLYFTNDDDERYSIQAEERLLRNLTVEVADPPLGYSIYSSKLLRQGLEYF